MCMRLCGVVLAAAHTKAQLLPQIGHDGDGLVERSERHAVFDREFCRIALTKFPWIKILVTLGCEP